MPQREKRDIFEKVAPELSEKRVWHTDAPFGTDDWVVQLREKSGTRLRDALDSLTYLSAAHHKMANVAIKKGGTVAQICNKVLQQIYETHILANMVAADTPERA